MKCTAMTFNLRMDTSADGVNAWPNRKEKVIERITTHEPAVLGTQEGLHHMVRFMDEALPQYGLIGEGREGGENGEYNVLFYNKQKLELIDEGQFWLSETTDVPNSISWDSACPRICTWGSFVSVDDKEDQLVVFNTHLDHYSQLAREKGVQLIGEKMKKFLDKKIPVILMGDLNATPDNPVITYLNSLGLKETHSTGKTFHDFKGGTEGSPIDYIFVTSMVKVKSSLIDQEKIQDHYPSDHYPVISLLET